ncbi:MAG: AtpZ/AtpI family protein [Candidatus Anammoxibacter sp.]
MIFKPNDSKEAFRALGLVGGFGFMMGGAVLGTYYIGSYLDRRFESSPWFLIAFLIMGVIAVFLEFYKLLKKIIEKSSS